MKHTQGTSRIVHVYQTGQESRIQRIAAVCTQLQDAVYTVEMGRQTENSEEKDLKYELRTENFLKQGDRQTDRQTDRDRERERCYKLGL